MKGSSVHSPERSNRVGKVAVLLSWQINMLLFGLLVAVVIAVFSWQLQQLKATFQQHALERSRVVADVIEENLKNSLITRRALDEIAHDFLESSARFIIYLDSIEPFSGEELTAFAEEAGLAGIGVVRTDKTVVVGPPGWLPPAVDCSLPSGSIHYDGERNLGLALLRPGDADTLDCVLVGLDATLIRSLHQRTGLTALLRSLPALPGISYVRIEDRDNGKNEAAAAGVRLLRSGKGDFVAETRRTLDNGVLVVGLNAEQLSRRISSLRSYFFLFGIMLVVLGLFFSWLLYRHQQADLRRTRDFERLLAREHEAAALGRATATIAHEVRNPLNAINMGLQRLRLEWDNLNPEQEELVGAMGEAVRRTSMIVTELQRFSRPLNPKTTAVFPHRLLGRLLSPYESSMNRDKISFSRDIRCREAVVADGDMLAEVLENLIGNAVEAAAAVAEGFVEVAIHAGEGRMIISLRNNGFFLSEEEGKRLGQPYFTTRTRGTGLGLAISRRLVEAMGGRLLIRPDYGRKEISVSVELPRANGSRQPHFAAERSSETVADDGGGLS